ncbi:hypothetical protein E4T56_gene3352 [Termitomyces sp. T112]|nr:hypothetical protein E4T56_gene3352 [Termitomyces sp. T112]
MLQGPPHSSADVLLAIAPSGGIPAPTLVGAPWASMPTHPALRHRLPMLHPKECGAVGSNLTILATLPAASPSLPWPSLPPWPFVPPLLSAPPVPPTAPAIPADPAPPTTPLQFFVQPPPAPFMPGPNPSMPHHTPTEFHSPLPVTAKMSWGQQNKAWGPCQTPPSRPLMQGNKRVALEGPPSALPCTGICWALPPEKEDTLHFLLSCVVGAPSLCPLMEVPPSSTALRYFRAPLPNPD